MNLTIMGVQGAGKGTQAKMMAEKLSLPHISTGDLFRKNIGEGTELGARAKSYMDKGNLVPDAVVIDMVRDRIGQDDAQKGFILDGFPRSGVQLAALEFLRPVEHAVLLELDKETAIARLGGRSECRKCEILYGANRRPKQENTCDKCAGPLVIRGDDTDVDAVQRRIEIYEQEISCMVDYYEWKGVLRRVDANTDQDTVLAAIMSVIGAE